MTPKERRIEEIERRIEAYERELFLLDQQETLDQYDDVPDDDVYVPGCGEYDSRDSKGAPLLSRYNDAGEYRW